MSVFKQILFYTFLSVLIGLSACNQHSSNTNIAGESIFNLTENWHTQNNETIQLIALKGKVLVVVMIYTNCKSACPKLVAQMRSLEAQIPKEKLNKINFVLVSIDPEVDNPTRLKAFAKENDMDALQWTFLQGTKNSVQEFANVLAVKYKQISPIDFSHSNIVSVFNNEGVLIHQHEGLEVNNKETLETIIKTINL
jgi:protein SCO1/2